MARRPRWNDQPDRPARSLASMVVPPEKEHEIDFKEPSYKAEIEAERSLKPEVLLADEDPAAGLPKPRYLAKVAPIVEEMPQTAIPEPRPSLKPDVRDQRASYQNVPGVHSKFTPDRWLEFCNVFAETGRITHSAKAVGVSYDTVNSFRKNHPEFSAMFEEAVHLYRDRIRQEVYRRAVEGVVEDVFGKDGKVGTRRVYSDRLLELEAKRVDPSYRDKGASLEVNTTGGVLVVRDRQTMTPDQWEGEFKGTK